MGGLRAMPVTLAALLMLALGSCSLTAGQPVEGGLLITSIRIVDTESGSVSAPSDVIIRNGRIAEILAPGSGCRGSGCQKVDASGQYLLAGLWDLHTHLEAYRAPEDPDLDPSQWYAPLAMSYGVLGLRDLGSRTDDILALRARWTLQRQSGEVAPVLKVAGQSFSGKQPWGNFDHTLIPETPEQAAEMVRTQLARGVDFIKVHDFLEPEIYAAITQATVTAGRPVIGHLRPYSGPLESAAAGQRDFDHLPPELLAYCGEDGAAATYAFYDGWYSGGPGYYERAMAALYEPAGCQRLFEALAASEVSVTPTLSVRAPVRARTYDAAQRFLPEAQMEKCIESRRFRDAAGPSAEAYSAVIADVMEGLVSAQVEILAGTDGSAESCGVPGLILLDELDYLVEAGLSRQQVLHAATRSAALKAGEPDSGYIGEGAIADLILLEANPLENMAALLEPTGIISAGNYLERESIVALRDSAARYARPLPGGE